MTRRGPSPDTGLHGGRVAALAARAALAGLAVLVGRPGSAPADHCGPGDCGEGGTCREQSLVARCQCDDGWISVTTYLGGGSQGAWCARIPAEADVPACAGLACGPNGACLGEAPGACACDPGYAQRGNTCVDDPEDASEAPCRDVRCGEGATCMATPDGPTCRCRPGEFVVLGLDGRGMLGPVCRAPADPGSACGPEACGPKGRCVVSQAAFCRCEPGYTAGEAEGSDGRVRPFCLDADGKVPDAPAEGEGGEGEGEGRPTPTRPAPDRPRTQDEGCATTGVGAPAGRPAASARRIVGVRR